MAGSLNEFVLQTPEDKKIAKQKRWSFLNKYLYKFSEEKLYDENVLVQEFEPQPNWTLPEIEVDKLYKIHAFQFRATQLFRFTFVDIPISTGQKVYQVPLIKREDIEWV